MGSLARPGADRPMTRRTATLQQVPNPYQTLEEHERFHGRDIPGLPEDELARELELLRSQVNREDCPHPWRVARMAALRAELAGLRAGEDELGQYRQRKQASGNRRGLRVKVAANG